MGLAGEEILGQAARRNRQLLGLVERQIALSDQAQRKVNDNAQAADSPGFVVNVSLTRREHHVFHSSNYNGCTMMQQPDPFRTNEAIVAVHTCRSWTEAVVVRALLESAGIAATELGVGNPSPMPDLAPILYGIEIYVLESHADRARQMIAEYLAAVESGEDQENSEDDV